MSKEKLFRVVGQEPDYLSPEESQELALAAIEMLQKVERNYIGRDSVTVRLKGNDPTMLICASDLHAGSITTNHKSILELRDYALTHPNVGLVLLGDEVEGLKEAYLNTNTARTPIDFQQQIDLIRHMFLEPLANQGKILAMVSGYWGHPGWAEDATTINTWRLMTDGLDIPILRNGGELNIRFANGQTQSMMIWHNPPGSSPFDPVKGLRDVAFMTDERVRADGYMSGHIHRVGVAKEIYAGSKTAVYYISSGTAKGSSSTTPPDRYGVKLGLDLADPLGQGVIIEPKTKKGNGKNYPYASFRQGQVAFDAMRILDKTESAGTTDELLEEIRERVEARPTIKFQSGSSRVSGAEYTEDAPGGTVKIKGKEVENPYSKMRMRAPYDSLTYDIQTRLPIALHLISNARLGSSSEGYDELKQYEANLIASNPHSLVVYLRNMIDSYAGSSPDRMEILNKFRDLINGTREQTLAIMMCESLRQGSWGKVVGSREDYSAPIAPGSYLANETGVPLIHHLSMIKLGVGPGVKLKEKPLYVGAFADKLLKHGSYSRPTFGLRRMYDLYTQEKPGFVAGGHMPHAGAMTFFDRGNPVTDHPILVAPGWFAKYVDTMGKGNVMQGAEPGQAIIFMPGKTQSDYLALPTVNAAETEYLHDALTLMQGLEILGMTDKVLKRTR